MNSKMSIQEFSRWLEKQDEADIGKYGSGGYGVEKKNWFTSMVKALAKAYARGDMRVV